MKPFNTKSVKFKIVFYTMLCLVTVGVLSDYLHYADRSNQIDKLLAFNEQGLMLQASANLVGSSLDIPNLKASTLYIHRNEPRRPFSELCGSISPYQKLQCLAALFPITGYNLSAVEGGYLYVELNLSVVTDILAPYSKLNPIFVVTDAGHKLISPDWAAYSFYDTDFSGVKNGDTLTVGGKQYRVDIRALDTAGLSIYNCTDLSAVSVDNRNMSYVFLVVISSVMLVSACVLLLISNFITRPIQYNTLDSIHWMAVIQKNPGICNMTRALSNLLKNMAKSFSQKIPLREELKLLDDYVTIQSIRYMETFELINNINEAYYHYPIVKLTLQPLVENAIFHGIEPAGVYGTITLDAYEEGEFLIITVEDSGAGMSEEALADFQNNAAQERTRNSMNGIGIANVNQRLRLIYGPECGLTIESEQGSYTRVSVRIRKEEGTP